LGERHSLSRLSRLFFFSSPGYSVGSGSYDSAGVSSVSKNQQLSEMKYRTGLGFAIIGCGSAGKRRSTAIGKKDLRVACDLNLDRAQEVAHEHVGCRATPNAEEAILDPSVQVVIVATPHAPLASLTMTAVQSGKHVLVEKPGAIKSAELKAIQSVAAETGSLVRIGFNHRYSPAFQKAYELIRTQDFGPPLSIRARYGHGGRPGFTTEWRVQPAVSGGGVLIDMGVHLIDLASSFMGDFSAVDGHVANYFWDIPVEDNVFLNLRTLDNRTAWLHASYTEWKNLFSFEINFRAAKLHIEGIGRNYGIRRLYYYRTRSDVLQPDSTIFEYLEDDPSWFAELDEFREDIAKGRTPTPGLAEGIRTLEIMETIYQKELLQTS
jgi:predicted dehydrogenase